MEVHGYRCDRYFFNSNLTKSSFDISNNENETKYITTTDIQKGYSGGYDYPITLEIVVVNDNILKEIKISCTPTSMNVNGTLECAKEVEDALGYTLINARNYQIVEKVTKELKSENYVSNKGEVIQNNKSITIKDENENKTVTFTIGENNIEYKMIF